MEFSFSLDHAVIMEQVATFWAMINYNGMVAGLLNIGAAVLIWNGVRHMGDADKDIDTSEDDIEFGGGDTGAWG
jgi:hypothetical protein